MGDMADYMVGMFTSGKWGTPLPKSKVYTNTTKEEIRDNVFFVVEVVGGNTNRIVGTKLIVCEKDDTSYWVWASNKVTGISKSVCRPLSEGMSVSDAKDFRKKID